MFEYYGHIHVYSPRAGADNLLGSIFFSININFLSICILPASFLHLIPFYYFFPFKCISELSFPCRKIGQGHPRVMIYTNFVELNRLLLHAKFQNHRPSGCGEEDFQRFLLFIAMAAILVI